MSKNKQAPVARTALIQVLQHAGWRRGSDVIDAALLVYTGKTNPKRALRQALSQLYLTGEVERKALEGWVDRYRNPVFVYRLPPSRLKSDTD